MLRVVLQSVVLAGVVAWVTISSLAVAQDTSSSWPPKGCPPSAYSFPNSLFNGTALAEFTAPSNSSACALARLDAPKIHPRPNNASFDWWYFDAVTSDQNNANTSIVIILFHTSSTAFPTGFVDPGVIVSAVISATFADGTKFVKRIAAAPGDDGVITFTTGNDGAVEGVWSTTGFSFKGTNGLKNFVVRVNNTSAGLVGELTLKSTAEAHLPCGLVTPNATEEISPHIGWANAVPDADARAVFDLGGRRLEFSGYGYHDKNWGDQPFAALIQSWYWGHGRLGPFSIVWFDAIGTDGVERVSGFVSDASKGYSTTLRVVATSCQEGAVSARPFGNNSEYPPHLNSGTPDGFVLVFQLGDGRFLNVTARTTSVILDFPFYGRYTGLLTGGVVGRRRTFTGTALWEQFRF